MKHIIKITILSVLIICPRGAVAINSNPTHTNTPIEAELVSAYSEAEFRLAAVCFLGNGDCGAGSFSKGDDDMGVDTCGYTCKQCCSNACPA